MLDYIIILIAALIVFPFVFFLISKGKVQRSFLSIIASGLVIALLGIFIGKNYPFYYAVLIMFALAFALSVLLDKRLTKRVDEVSEKVSSENGPRVESEVQQYIQSEVAASVELEDDLQDHSSEDDLALWMSTDQEHVIVLEKEGDRGGK